MQQVIYADVLVFMNTVITFILLLTVKAYAGVPTAAGRMVLASFVGGLFSLVILAPKMHFLLLLLAKAGMCVSITFIAFSIKNIKKMLRCAALFLLVSYLYAGITYAVSYIFQTQYLYVNNGFSYLPVQVPTLVLLTAAVYGGMLLLKKYVFRKDQADMIYDAQITFGDREIRVKALMDSGNSLRDIYTGKPVVILASSDASLLTGIGRAEDYTDVLTADTGVCFRLLPVHTLNGEKLLPAFTVDRVRITDAQTEKVYRGMCVAVTDHPLGSEKYQALIGAELI